MDIQIRQANREDLKGILDLYAQPEMDDGKVLELPVAQQIFERIRSYPRYSIYVAIVHGAIVGTFALLIMDNLAHTGASSGIAEDVVVHPDWRRHGIGRRMMEFAMDECRKAGCYKLALSSNIKRASAHEFYLSLGFAPHGYSFIVDFEQD